MIAKPPPPSPSRGRLSERKSVVSSLKQLDHYKLPMFDTYTPSWVKVLKDCGYPTDILVVDFESYFDETYSMKDLSTVEYVMDKRWEVLGCAFLPMSGQYPFAEYEQAAYFSIGEERVAGYLGDVDWDHTTIINQNSNFDASVLALRYGIYPKYIVDTLCLARAWNSRQKHGLDVLTKQFGLIEKGDTQDFKGLSFRTRYQRPKGRGPKMPVRIPTITDEQVGRLTTYASNDAARTYELMTILLPRLSNAPTELRIQKHTLDLMLRPVLRVDAVFGEQLADMFDAEVDNALKRVAVLYG